MNKFFLKMMIWWMGFDVALTRQRLQECRDQIAHDEARIEQLQWQLRQMEFSHD